MAWPMIAAAAGQAASGIATSLMNMNQAGINRDDQRYYTEHAHQVEVNDLRAAGLNPILSATGGSGAHAPGMSSPDISGGMGNVAASAASLAQIPQMMANVEKTAQETANLQADQALKAAQAHSIAQGVEKEDKNRPYWEGNALNDAFGKFLGLDYTRASTAAAHSSAAAYEAGAKQSLSAAGLTDEQLKVLKRTKGFTGTGGMAMNAASLFYEKVVKPILEGKPSMPVGQSSAADKRGLPPDPMGN